MPKRILDPSLLRALKRPRPGPSSDAAATDPARPARDRAVHESLGIRIDRDGTWFYHGSAIHRKELVCLFASALRRDADGRYWLVTPSEMGPVEVEDAPFIAVEMYRGGKGGAQQISFRTNVDEIVTLGPEHALRVIFDPASGEPSPYVELHDGREARLSRAVYYELAELAEPGDSDGEAVFGVRSCGMFFAIGPVGGGE
jgi:hypothetical protein